jgi:hypothetical protein
MKGRFDLHDYSDIIDLPHHVSVGRRRMSNVERGAQFSPFAALTGYDTAVSEAGRLTDHRVSLSEDAKAFLDARLQMLSDRLDEEPEISVLYFAPDSKKAGGSYRSYSGTVRAIDPILKKLVMHDHTEIEIEQIYDIDGEIFQIMELDV